MSKKSLLFGAIVSIITTNAIANQVLTSQTYVDNADALKQDKITAGTTGNVVTYNGTTNGQAQFSERGFFDWQNDTDGIGDGSRAHINQGSEGKLISADVYVVDNQDIWESIYAIDGAPETVVVRNAYGSPYDERASYNGATTYNSSTDADKIPTTGAVMAAISNNTPTLPTGTANTVVMYNNSGAIGGSRAIYDGSATYNATNDATKLVTANGVSKMKECTRWIDNAAHTDENCLLWRLP